MSDFGTVTFDRIKEQYADLDVGANAIYQVIAQLLQEDDPESARMVALAAMEVHSVGDPFIVDDVTQNTDVFLEVFRRAFFVPEPAPEFRDIWREQIKQSGQYLTNVRAYLLRQML